MPFGTTGSRPVLPKMCTPGGPSEQGCKRASATIKQPGKVASLHPSAVFFPPSNFSQVYSGRGCSCAVAFFLSNLLTFPIRLAKSFCWNSTTVSESFACLYNGSDTAQWVKMKNKWLIWRLLLGKKDSGKESFIWGNAAVVEEQSQDDALFCVVPANPQRRPLSSSVSAGAAGWGEKRLRVASCWPSFCFRPRAAVSPRYTLSSHITDLTPTQHSWG